MSELAKIARSIIKEAGFFSRKKKEPSLIDNDEQRESYKVDFYKHKKLEDKTFAKYIKTENEDVWHEYANHAINASIAHKNYMAHKGAEVLSEYHHNL